MMITRSTSTLIWSVSAGVCLMAATEVFIVCRICRTWMRSQRDRYEHRNERLVRLVREMIDEAYIYDNDPEKFYRRFEEKIAAASLDARGVVDADALLRDVRYNRTSRSLRREDALLWALVMSGFTTRELKVVYGLKNINSVYVKIHRLRSRLDRRMQELLDKRDL